MEKKFYLVSSNKFKTKDRHIYICIKNIQLIDIIKN